MRVQMPLGVRLAVGRGQAPPEPRVPLSLVVASGIIAIFLIALVTVLSFRDAIKSTAGGPAIELATAGPRFEPSERWLTA